MGMQGPNCVYFSLLNHIISSSLDDSEDILQRRNCFIGQVNNIVCCCCCCVLLVQSELDNVDEHRAESDDYGQRSYIGYAEIRKPHWPLA